MEYWEKLPVVIRWILLFPIYLILTIVIGIVIRISVLAGGLPVPVFNLLFPPIMAVVSLFVMYHLAPSIKFKIIVCLISLRSLFIPIFLIGFYAAMKGAEIDMSWNEWWAPFIGEILTLIASIWFYKYLKNEYAIVA